MLHSELVTQQPAPNRLTHFYLYISMGGMVGGLLVGVVSPSIIPLQLEVEFCSLCVTILGWQQFVRRYEAANPFGSTGVFRFVSALIVLGVLIGFGHQIWKRLRGQTEVYRSYYGSLQVKSYPIPQKRGGLTHLLDGRISHGYQYRGQVHRRKPTSYFVKEAGIGQILSKSPSPKRVGIMGLGVGTLACYAKDGDHFRFYELNPDVLDVAQTHFTYLKDAQGEVNITLGDGRLELERQEPQNYDVLIIDAFTGDAIPAHLLTSEAFDLYLAHLTTRGVLAINISNRHADLGRVVQAQTQRLNLTLQTVRHTAKSPFGPYTSEWAILTKSPSVLDSFNLHSTLKSPMKAVEWTDDFAPLLPILR